MLRFVSYCGVTMFALISALGAAEGETKETPPKPAHRVIVYYLHNTWRCPGCNSVESLSRAAVLGGKGENSKAGTAIEVRSPFAGDVEAGRLSFQSVNVDLKENKPLLKTLGNNLKVPVVAVMQGDRIVSFTPLAEAWDYLGDNAAFVRYVQDGAEPAVKKVRPDPEDGDKK